MADDAGGRAVAHRGLGAVRLFNYPGKPRQWIVSCEGLATSNIAFGGPGGTTLFITESNSGTVQPADAPARGRLIYSHM